MKLLSQAPEIPINETWTWQSDVMVSNNGTEQRVQNCEIPFRNFNEQLIFSSLADVRLQLTNMMGFGAAFYRPLFAYQTRLLAASDSGDAALTFNGAATEIRDGSKAYVFDRNGGELVSVAVVSAGGCTLSAPLSGAYRRGSWVAPVSVAVVGNNAAYGRFNADDSAKAQLNYREVTFLYPFLNPLNAVELTMLGDFPVLDRRPFGTDFEDDFDTGIEIHDEGGAVSIYSPWSHAQITSKRRFLCHRYQDLPDWNWWRKFADYARGSANPFYLSTNRADFGLETPPVPGGGTLVFSGTDYATDFFPFAPFKALAISTSIGIHYATVTSAIAAAGNTNVTFSPALPADSGAIEKASLLLLSRIADDVVSCYHNGLDTEIELAVRTVDL